MPVHPRAMVCLAALLLALAGCTGGEQARTDEPSGIPFARAGPSGIVTPPTSSSAPASEAATDPQTGGPVDIATDVVAADLEAPWAVAGEGGLMGLAVSPDYADDGRLYAYLTTPQDNRIVRFRPGEPPEPVVTGIPSATIHNGGRIAFGPDRMLQAGTGDAGNAAHAQDRGSLGGKILRVTPDGDVPDDNPFDGSPVWSLGHRNVQGLAWDADGRMWASEFGPDRDDEINRVEAGGNYGWPIVTGRSG